MDRIDKSFEINVPRAAAQEGWREFDRSRAELAGLADVRFERIARNRTRVSVSGESASVEGTCEEFRQFVENYWRTR